MTNDTLLKLIDRCRISEGEELVPNVAYRYTKKFMVPHADLRNHIEDHDIILLLYHGKKAGAILRCGRVDVHWTVKEEFRGKHILSDFLRRNILSAIWPENTETELVDIWCHEEYHKKKHLAELAGLRIKNLDQLESHYGKDRAHR